MKSIPMVRLVSYGRNSSSEGHDFQIVIVRQRIGKIGGGKTMAKMDRIDAASFP
jgi:hypothetical protein